MHICVFESPRILLWTLCGHSGRSILRSADLVDMSVVWLLCVCGDRWFRVWVYSSTHATCVRLTSTLSLPTTSPVCLWSARRRCLSSTAGSFFRFRLSKLVLRVFTNVKYSTSLVVSVHQLSVILYMCPFLLCSFRGGMFWKSQFVSWQSWCWLWPCNDNSANCLM